MKRFSMLNLPEKLSFLPKFAQILKKSKESVRSISESAGFLNYVYFTKLFKKRLGCTPTEYRKSSKKSLDKA
jgi:AraC-like DNA-binding protein